VIQVQINNEFLAKDTRNSSRLARTFQDYVRIIYIYMTGIPNLSCRNSYVMRDDLKLIFNISRRQICVASKLPSRPPGTMPLDNTAPSPSSVPFRSQCSIPFRVGHIFPGAAHPCVQAASERNHWGIPFRPFSRGQVGEILGPGASGDLAQNGIARGAARSAGSGCLAPRASAPWEARPRPIGTGQLVLRLDCGLMKTTGRPRAARRAGPESAPPRALQSSRASWRGPRTRRTT